MRSNVKQLSLGNYSQFWLIGPFRYVLLLVPLFTKVDSDQSPTIAYPRTISIGHSMICTRRGGRGDSTNIWRHKIPKLHTTSINTTSSISKMLWARRRVKFETVLKYHELYLCQISRTNHANHDRKVFVISTCRYFKLSCRCPEPIKLQKFLM